MLNNNNKRLSLSVSPSTSGGLANRRRNNKNLSLCLSPETTHALSESIKTAPIKQQDDVNAYPLGPVKIMDNLYLGSEKNANDLNHLRTLSITSILNVAAEVHNPYENLFQPMDVEIIPIPSLSKASSVSSGASSIQTIQSTASEFVYQKLPWEHNQDNLVVELQKAIDIIDRARASDQSILVHCQCGVARSATVIIAYMMKVNNLPMQEAYTLVKEMSPVISPNLRLLFQLREFEQTFTKKPTTIAPSPLPTQTPLVQTMRPKTRPNSWMVSPTPITTTAATPNSSRFLCRASSISNNWKKRFSTKTKSIFSTKEEDKTAPGWWKNRKLSTDVCV